jgi:glycosyltransferase involved in cell wall biosynthesis
MLRAADRVLTVSPGTSGSLVKTLHLDQTKLHWVGAGTASRLSGGASTQQARDAARAFNQDLESSFVLYIADDAHDLEAAIVAFARLPEALRGSYQLVVYGQFPALETSHLRHLADFEGIESRVVWAKPVPEEEMLRLYQAAELICFPLGAGYDPRLAEARASGSVVIVPGADALQSQAAPRTRPDRSDPLAIRKALERGLGDAEFREASREQTRNLSTTWAQVASRTASVYEELLVRPHRPWRRRRRIAIISPFPPVASGIANYSFRLVEKLASLGDFDIDCFADGLDRSPERPSAPLGLPIYDARGFLSWDAATAGYDDVIYVLGNSEFHGAAFSSLRRRRGTVLAHDVRLSGLYHFAARSRTATQEGLADTLHRIYGPVLPGSPAFADEGPASRADTHGLLMAREAISLADRFLVTSQAAARLARIEAGPGLASRVGVVGFATEVVAARASAGISTAIDRRARVLASFGIVDPIKQPHKLLRTFAALATSDPDLILALVGPVSTELAHDLASLGEELGIADRLIITGRVEADAYRDWLERTDLAVQLRGSFSGEASAAVGDCLACGVPMIVTDIGWMGELPDRVVFKVPPDVSSADLAEACGRLLEDKVVRAALSNQAHLYAGDHSFEAAARGLLAILDEPSRLAG